MEYFIKYLERKIEACDELGGLQREKAVYQSTLKEYRKAINVIQCCKSDSDVVADIRNKLGSVTALIDLIKLRKTEHADYAESKLDTQVLQAIESIKYIKQL